MTKKEVEEQVQRIKEWLEKGLHHKINVICKNEKELDLHKELANLMLDKDMLERITWKVDKNI